MDSVQRPGDGGDVSIRGGDGGPGGPGGSILITGDGGPVSIRGGDGGSIIVGQSASVTGLGFLTREGALDWLHQYAGPRVSQLDRAPRGSGGVSCGNAADPRFLDVAGGWAGEDDPQLLKLAYDDALECHARIRSLGWPNPPDRPQRFTTTAEARYAYLELERYLQGAAPDGKLVQAGVDAEEVGRLLALAGDGTGVDILRIARDERLSVDERMRALAEQDHRLDAYDSPKWAQLLGVSAAAVRLTEFWKSRKQRKEWGG